MTSQTTRFPGPFTKKGLLNVIIETPAKSRNKFAYDNRTGLYKLKKVVPAGLEFPCDMGFIPNTKGEDGDPLDVLVFMDEITYPGCLVECRLLGVLTATQKEKGEKVRNDRFVAVPSEMWEYDHLKEIKDLNEKMLESIVEFFKEYNKREGKKFHLQEIAGPGKARKLIEKATRKAGS
jgi:inorganic pyrophosphatase